MRGVNMGEMTDFEGCLIEIVSDKDNYIKESMKAFEKCENYKTLITKKLKGFEAKAYSIRYESGKKLAEPMGHGGFRVVSGDTKLDFTLWVKVANEASKREIEEAIKELPELLNLRSGNEITYKVLGGDKIELHIKERPSQGIIAAPFAKVVRED